MIQGVLDRVRAFFTGRNPKFYPAERKFIAGKECVWCRHKAETAHHGYPVHAYPEREMDEDYWVPTCRKHHLPYCHNGDWSLWVEVTALIHAAMLMRGGSKADAMKIIEANTLGPKRP